jgi:para-nitrobenzyl esterase
MNFWQEGRTMTTRDRQTKIVASTDGIDRRTFCKGATVAVGAALLTLPSWRSTALAADGPVAETTSGKISGVTTNGVHAFRGVPYGAPTGGRSRFMPPQKPQPWAGVRSAVDWAGRAPQSPPDRTQRPELGRLSAGPDRVPESEDCLVVNVWTRGLNDGGKRPVMVWYHGGGFGYGSSNSPRLDGTNLATHHDVMVVTVNQRLNILGHMQLADLGGEDFAQSGNSGTLDMVAAL